MNLRFEPAALVEFEAAVLYYAERDVVQPSSVLVLAIAHLSRRPSHWRDASTAPQTSS